MGKARVIVFDLFETLLHDIDFNINLEMQMCYPQ